MTVLVHELRQGRLSFMVWTGAITLMLGVCILIYPEMSAQMEEVSSVFGDMGSFSQAFGMDKINFGEFIGFFSVECGNVLGLGGAFFAALLGISALAKEEKEHTAEFLLTHPLSRARIVTEKLCAVAIQILLLNLAAAVVTALSVLLIGEDPDVKTLVLLFTAHLLMQLEVAAITFGISAFLSQGALGIGLGLAALFYFLNILANLTEGAEFLNYITPFGYTEGADILEKGAINGGYLCAGITLSAVSVILAFWKYQKKDIS